MIQASELRIGNFIEDRNGFRMQVIAIFKDTCYLDFDGNEGNIWEEDLISSSPIALTPEILEKAGFVHPNGREYFVHKNDLNKNLSELRINKIKGKWTCSIGCDKHGIILGFYETFHQLQNLYFSLTGEELEINL